jgi:hypothetical protein
MTATTGVSYIRPDAIEAFRRSLVIVIGLADRMQGNRAVSAGELLDRITREISSSK